MDYLFYYAPYIIEAVGLTIIIILAWNLMKQFLQSISKPKDEFSKDFGKKL